MESELKNCPFCGGEAKAYSNVLCKEMVDWIACRDCGASTSPAAWNKRPSPAAVVWEGEGSGVQADCIFTSPDGYLEIPMVTVFEKGKKYKITISEAE